MLSITPSSLRTLVLVISLLLAFAAPATAATLGDLFGKEEIDEAERAEPRPVAGGDVGEHERCGVVLAASR